MKKYISALTALLLCANVSMCEQEKPTINLSGITDRRTGFISDANIHIVSTLTKKHNVPSDAAVIEDIHALDVTLTKFEFDYEAAVSVAMTIAQVYACGHHLYNKNLKRALLHGICGSVFAFIGYETITSNLAESNRQRAMHAPVNRGTLCIHKENGDLLLKVYGKSNDDELAKQPKKSQEEIRAIAQEIIANHNESVDDQGRYTSEIFKGLIADFDHSCYKVGK